MLGPDEQALDSTLKENQRKAAALGKTKAMVSNETPVSDSLLSGPAAPFESDDSAAVDSLGNPLPDSLARKRPRVHRIPRRYEQRIFQAADRSLFGGARGAVGRDYVLGPGDEVTVSLWGDKEKEYTLLLNSDGKVFLEGVGLVPLSGLNLNEAQARLKEKLAKIYSGIARGTAHVDVSLGKTGPVKVFVLGEVKVPGGYVFNGNAGILSAMYYAKGPTNIGTVRNLQLTRAGKKFPLDLYQYLIYGQSLTPEVLQDGDILFAGRADILVGMEGDVGRPAVYELKKGEGVKELLEFAGRANPTAAMHRMVLERILPGGRIDYLDLATPQEYMAGKAKVDLQDGDRIVLRKSTEPSSNYLTISGPVKYPGTYPAEGTLTVTDLVKRAGGLREDAFLGRAHVVRFNADGSSQLFAYSLDTMRIDSIRLAPKDNVVLYSLKDMYRPDTVQISGAVFNPGKYEFRRGMTAKDLVMQAGGFMPHHEPGKILIFREDPTGSIVEQLAINSADGLAKSDELLLLSPGDVVQIPVNPNWYKTEVVTLEGLFLHPGKYGLLHPGEKLASVIERAGGFKDNAYVQGGRFFRAKDSVGRVGVDLHKALHSPGSKANISLVAGDSIFIPERLTTVKVIGEVGFETSVLYQEGASVHYYIEKAGGFTRRSEKSRVVVQYANGETSRDNYFNRKPDAGSVIFVPQGPEPKSIDWIAGINGLLATMGVAAAVILSIQAINNK